jgi:prepilin-type N-terminal cleavage/methylation domain-containing protein
MLLENGRKQAMLEEESKCNVCKSQGGFTFIELIMVIGILGMLAAIGVQQLKFNRENAFDRQAQSIIRNLLTYAAIDTPQGGDGMGHGGSMALFGYPEVELPENVYWSVDNDDEDRWRFYFAHPGGITGFYFWVPGETYGGSLDDDLSVPPNRSDKLIENAANRAAVGI